ncbi:MAG: ATP-binding cassette domain-containing protein [Ignavibacteriales bacterium]|nr:ATP-binding cassette domain-containing protein [Ignavibacteriales bacterium]
MMNELIKIENISYAVDDHSGKKKIKIVEDISLDIYKGEILGIVGESGCGKTTLAKLIASILKCSSGRINYYYDSSIKREAKPAQILFQNSEELINPFRKINDSLEDGTSSDKSFETILAETGVDKNLLTKLGYQLSGGERQRVGLARILLADPELLILDEPFSAQDFPSKNKFKELIGRLNSDGKLTTIIITHELDLLENLVDRIAVMYGGRIVEIAPADKFFVSPRHPYSKFLLESGKYLLERKNIVLDEENNSSFCNYYNRCAQKKEDCLSVLKRIEIENHIVFCNHPEE